MVVCVIRLLLCSIVTKQKCHNSKLNIMIYSAAACHFSPLVPLQKVSDIRQTHLSLLPHPREAYKLPESQPNVFCVTVNVCCSLHLAGSKKAQGWLLVKKEGGKDSAEHLHARGAQVY